MGPPKFTSGFQSFSILSSVLVLLCTYTLFTIIFYTQLLFKFIFKLLISLLVTIQYPLLLLFVFIFFLAEEHFMYSVFQSWLKHRKIM